MHWHSISHYAYSSSKELTTTAPCDGVVIVDIWLIDNWGYGGGTLGLSVSDVSGLTTLYSIKDKLSSGDTIGRTLHARRMFYGVEKNTSYTFSAVLSGSGGASPQWVTTAEFRPM